MNLETITSHDPRLGRHVHHDPRSVRFGVPTRPKSAISSVFWERRAPIWDQGALGSCTGHATAGYLATDRREWAGRTSVMVKAAGNIGAGLHIVDKDLAERIYSLNTTLDPFPGQWPPEDTGSSGLACAKSLQALGLCDTYLHAFSLEAAQAAIQDGPLLFGTIWLNSMFEAKADGHVSVLQRSGVAGGHELLITAYEAPTGGVTRGQGKWWLTNSWGKSWAKDGRGWITDGELRWLMSQQGDITVPNLIQDVTPPPPPAPDVTADVADRALWGAVQVWAEAKGLKDAPPVQLPPDGSLSQAWRAHR